MCKCEDCNCVEKKLKIVSLPHCIKLPEYKTECASGMDLVACIDDTIVLNPLERVMIPTGIKVGIPKGYEGQIRPRSGKAYRDGITVINTPGTIDSDFTGELKILAVNLSDKMQMIQRGERIAQLVITPVVQLPIEIVGELEETERGEGGFGHTGKF